MKTLTREMILNCEDVKSEEIEVPEWGGAVTIRMMTGKERDAFEASIVKDGKASFENIRAKLVARTVIDPATKELLFTVGDVDALGQKSAVALDRIFSASQKLSKITEKDVDELTKN